MKVGDHVQVIGVPPGLPDDPDLPTHSLIEACVGKVFPIISIEENRIELHVGNLLGKADYMHSIYLEPEYVTPIQ